MKRLVASVRRGMILVLLIALAILSASCGGGASETTETDEEAPAESASTAQESTEQTSNTEVAAAATEGQKLFITYCAKCHGPNGLGDGPSVGSLRTQAGMNLTILQDRSDEEILTTISQGKGTEMPPWGLLLNLEEREELVKHLRTLGSQ